MKHFLLTMLVGLSTLTQAQAPLPGVYDAGQCGPAPFPIALPPIDSVVDTISLRPALVSSGVNKRVVLALRVGALEALPMARVVERKVPEDVAAQVAVDVEAALQPVPRDRAWAFRLRIEGDGGSALTLERSEVCAAVPPAPEIRTEALTVSNLEIDGLMRKSNETVSRLQVMRHRVLVDPTGRVLVVSVSVTSGDAAMDAAHASGLRRDPFTPTKLDGVPVTAWVEVGGNRILRTLRRGADPRAP